MSEKTKKKDNFINRHADTPDMGTTKACTLTDKIITAASIAGLTLPAGASGRGNRRKTHHRPPAELERALKRMVQTPTLMNGMVSRAETLTPLTLNWSKMDRTSRAQINALRHGPINKIWSNKTRSHTELVAHVVDEDCNVLSGEYNNARNAGRSHGHQKPYPKGSRLAIVAVPMHCHLTTADLQKIWDHHLNR